MGRAENFPELVKDMNRQNKEAFDLLIQGKINKKKSTNRMNIWSIKNIFLKKKMFVNIEWIRLNIDISISITESRKESNNIFRSLRENNGVFKILYRPAKNEGEKKPFR